MKPFDLQEALNGAPINVEGEKCYVLRDVTDLLDNPKETRYLVVFPSNHTDAELWTEDYFEGSSMWEEPELTSEQVLEKAYQENLPLDAIGKKAFVIAKTKGGDYVMQCGEDNLYFASRKTEWEFYKAPAEKSDIITVTLPRPVRPREVGLYWRIVTKNNALCIEEVMCLMEDCRDTPACNYFAAEADAQAWIDAIANALDD
uniref:Uncharacterized protein n=1 Tax=Myoviridae sp. ctKZW4 TaxID=2826639 RepID=A0A8S5NBV6_9CAUD|nr:MAG TPA: hypothetical protein [Myoviridae sp. ctKZW4]